VDKLYLEDPMPSLVSKIWRLAVAILCGLAPLLHAAPDYAVVVSQNTRTNGDWGKVVEALVNQHHATVLTFVSSIAETLPALRTQFPRFVCFVAQPAEATREFVAQVHRLTRRLDDDPYPDVLWGILTGYDAQNAWRIATHQEPLTIHNVGAGTEIALELCDQGTWFSELKKNRMVKKTAGQSPAEQSGPDDTTEALVNLLNSPIDLWVTSGHATERDWQIGYGFKAGSFRCENGQLYGLDLQGRRFPVASSRPKVYLPVGNCLMGHIDGLNSMSLAYMNSAGIRQMIGYTVTTWYGYAGWGCLDYFVEQPGRYTFTEAFAANQIALLHRLSIYFPELIDREIDANGRATTPISVDAKAREAGLTAQDGRGLMFDRDYLAFYGDPAWEARMASQALPWEQTLTGKAGTWTLQIKPRWGARSFQPINTNGSQRGYRPFIQFLPQRLRLTKILEGADLAPVIADNFILVPNPRQCDPERVYQVVFQAAPIR
jgi:hypothetical protein